MKTKRAFIIRLMQFTTPTYMQWFTPSGQRGVVVTELLSMARTFPTSKKAYEFVSKYGDAGYGMQKSEVEVLPLLITNTPDAVGHPSFTYTLETE